MSLMNSINSLLDTMRSAVRAFMHQVAKFLNRLTGGRLTPNMVTVTGLVMHLVIAWLIAVGNFGAAAVLLIIFGLADALDGELARLQGKASNAGMLLDASSDRLKEVFLYTGTALSAVEVGRPNMAAWSVLACGASLCVSYVKAKGETAVAGKDLSPNQVNRLFQDGLGRFEIRMTILVLGLMSGRVILATIVIALLSLYTTLERLMKISRQLND